MDIIIAGSKSQEEIVKITIHLKSVEKVEASFSSRTILHFYVGQQMYQAMSQALAMVGIASFSLVDTNKRRIRICLEQMKDTTLLTQYFRQNAIFCRICDIESEERKFFSPLQKSSSHIYDSYDSYDLSNHVSTIKTFKYLDRDTFACKVCDFYGDKKDTVIRHVNEFHIKPRRRMSDHDTVKNYIELEESEEDD